MEQKSPQGLKLIAKCRRLHTENKALAKEIEESDPVLPQPRANLWPSPSSVSIGDAFFFIDKTESRIGIMQEVFRGPRCRKYVIVCCSNFLFIAIPSDADAESLQLLDVTTESYDSEMKELQNQVFALQREIASLKKSQGQSADVASEQQ